MAPALFAALVFSIAPASFNPATVSLSAKSAWAQAEKSKNVTKVIKREKAKKPRKDIYGSSKQGTAKKPRPQDNAKGTGKVQGKDADRSKATRHGAPK